MTLSIPSDIWKPEFQAIMCQNVLFPEMQNAL